MDQATITMPSHLDIDIYQPEPYDIDEMARVFLNSFELDGSVKLMYNKVEILPKILAILHDYMDEPPEPRIKFIIAVTRKSRLMAGWMSYGCIDNGQVPEFAYNEMTSWAAQRLLRFNMRDPRFLLAAELEDRSREGQRQHTPGNRLVINTIVTDPDYRRRHVAENLVRYAMGRVRGARRTDWAVWVQTPAIYENLFWRHEFQDVGGFSLDLNDFKSEEEVARGIHGRQFGVQAWKQMKLASRSEEDLLKRTAAERALAEKDNGYTPSPNGTQAGREEGWADEQPK